MFSWDNVYRNENDNYDKDGLEGEVWFGEHSTERIVKWCLQNKDVIPTSSSIIDLGKRTKLIWVCVILLSLKWSMGDNQYSHLI